MGVETICALSTPYGRSAIALLKISGPQSRQIVSEMFGQQLRHRHCIPGILRDAHGRTLDEVVVSFFEAPNSYTGEDLVEVACHGNPKIVEEILSHIVSRGTRLAEPGEFTRRALTNQKLSIDQVEALDSILNAPTREGLDAALRVKTEGLGTSVSEISDLLADLRIKMESQLDFSEAEVGAYDPKEIESSAVGLEARLKSWTLAYESNRHLFGRWVVALVGHPNSGKSSLFNALIKSEKAIVFDQPGTTRDYLTQEVEFEGVPVTFIDTAGIRENPDPIEGLGIAKTFEMMKRAEVICWVDDRGAAPPEHLKDEFKEKAWLFVGSKADLGRKMPPAWVLVSSKTGMGLDELSKKLLPPQSPLSEASDWAPLISKRQYLQVKSGIGHLEAAIKLIHSGGFLDQAAEEVRLATQSIRALVDPSDPDQLIKSIFARFCIGK